MFVVIYIGKNIIVARLSDMTITTGFYHQYISVLMRSKQLSVAHPSFCWNTGEAITGCHK